MKFKSLSQKVLERRRKRIASRIHDAVFILAVVSAISTMGFSAWRTNKTYLAVNAPSWAEFKVNMPQKRESIMAANQDGLPLKLTINGEFWDIVKADHFNDSEDYSDGQPFNGIQAETHCSKKIIVYIQTDDPALLRANLWHEIMHAGACLHGGDTWWNSINPTKTQHDGILHLGEFLGAFSRANPQFMLWAANSSTYSLNY